MTAVMPAIALARMDTQRATWTGHKPIRWNATHNMPPVRRNMTRAPVARHGTSVLACTTQVRRFARRTDGAAFKPRGGGESEA